MSRPVFTNAFHLAEYARVAEVGQMSDLATTRPCGLVRDFRLTSAGTQNRNPNTQLLTCNSDPLLMRFSQICATD
jgi:hypothetical protein